MVGSLNTTSGHDTTLKGAIASGNTVIADIGTNPLTGGNLRLESEQDTQNYNSKQTSTSGGISYTFGAGSVGGSISSGQEKINSNYASVYEQTAIRAGEGGFNINVQNNTGLKGAVIDSQANLDKNNLTTGTLTNSDIRNQMDAKASSSGISLNSDMLDSKYAAIKGAASNLLNDGKADTSDDSATLSAIAPASIVITNQVEQEQTTGLTAQTTIASLNRDTSNTNRVLEKPDVQALQQQAQQIQQDRVLLLTTATAFTDESFRKIFLKDATINVLLRNSDGSIQYDEQGNPKFRELTSEEKLSLKPSADNKVHITNNGINNTIEAAAKYADQHSTANGGEQYFIYFPVANNGISELMIAAYQNFMENSSTGLTNSTQETVNVMQTYGATGLHIDGHSRGGLTTGNALEYLSSQGGAGSMAGTSIYLFGSAYNAEKADELLSILQGRENFTDVQLLNNMVIKQETHQADFVGYLLGNNRVTGGTIPEESSFIKETIRIMGGAHTAHSCYMKGSEECKPLWGDSLPILTPVRIYPTTK